MKYVFANKNLKLLFHDPDIFPKDYPREIVKKYVKAIFFIEQARDIRDFYGASGYDFEKLGGDLKGKYSMRLNDQWRLIVSFTNEREIQIVLVEKITKHYE